MIYWFRKYFSDPAGHRAALSEVVVTAIFSLLPFFISFLVESAKKTDGTYADPSQLVGRGQIYLLSYGIFGTIFWLAFVKGDRPRHGARVFFGTIGTFAVFPIVGFLGVDPTFSTILNSRIVGWSYVFYALFLWINYLLLFYMNITPPNPAEVFSREADKMQSDWREFSRHG